MGVEELGTMALAAGVSQEYSGSHNALRDYSSAKGVEVDARPVVGEDCQLPILR